MSSKPPKKLVVEFNVTGLSPEQIASLEAAASAQGEASDGSGGKHYEKGGPGHPDALSVTPKIIHRGRGKYLSIEFDVTGFTKMEIDYLATEAGIQAEADEDDFVARPDVPVTTTIK